jgi:hypothetical protein
MTVVTHGTSATPFFFVYVWGGVFEAGRFGETRTVGRPITSGDDTVHALLGSDLLAKRGDARICDESRVESVHAVPGRISRVSAAEPVRACAHQRG